MICKHCGEEIAIDEDVGWIHQASQSHFGQRCDKCGGKVLMRGTPAVCPHCQERAIFHLDHRAEPSAIAPTRKATWALRYARLSRTHSSADESGHAEKLLKVIEKGMIEPDAAALRHLALHRGHAPDWMD